MFVVPRFSTFAASRWCGLVATVAVGLSSGTAAADQSPFDTRQKSEEQEMLAKARQEAADQRRAARTLQGTVALPMPSAGPAHRGVSSGEITAEAQAREAELQRLSDKLRRASQLRATRPAAPVVDTPWRTEVTVLPDTSSPKPDYRPDERSALGHRAAASTAIRVSDAASDERVTVLMVMNPGKRGIRRLDRTADPILCSNDGCYISNGSATPAQFVSLRRSFGFLNTFGPRAGACRHSTACVFRGVDISASNAILQPVDLRVMLHDRREMKAAIADETCRVDAGRIACERPLRGNDFTMWVIPERVAARAGSDALARAVEEGLPDPARRAAINPR